MKTPNADYSLEQTLAADERGDEDRESTEELPYIRLRVTQRRGSAELPRLLDALREWPTGTPKVCSKPEQAGETLGEIIGDKNESQRASK